MDWSASGAPLATTGAVQTNAIAAGSIIFRTVVATPVICLQPTAAMAFRDYRLPVACFGLIAAAISDAVWLLLQAASTSGLPLDEALTADVLSTVATNTQFGEVTILRAVIVMGLSAFLVCDRAIIAQQLGLLLALVFTASLAWIDHAGASSGAAGDLHLAAGAPHPVAAAAWIGGLIPFMLLLIAACRGKSISLARDMVERFSRSGLVSVATLVVTGLIDTVILVGLLHALIVTAYGRILVSKLALFAMLALALVNCAILTPRLTRSRSRALRCLARNRVVELATGLAILDVAGLVDVSHPAIHSIG